MRIRGCMVEYSLNEAAKMLAISPDELKHGVEKGNLRYYYRLQSQGYQFHEASILTNRELLAQRHQFSRPNVNFLIVRGIADEHR